MKIEHEINYLSVWDVYECRYLGKVSYHATKEHAKQHIKIEEAKLAKKRIDEEREIAFGMRE